MQIVDNKVLVVTTPTPDAILSAITKSKVISESNGDYEVAVHWGMDEARALTVLGSKAPSPILRDYKWTGKFTPFAHQKETSSFLTLNDKAFCFSQAGCVDSDTEYLSPTGWVRMADYAGGKVAQYHPETRQMEFVEPTEYVKLPCAGMVRIKTKYGLDQLLSPEHRVLLESKNRPAKREVLSAVELLARHDRHLGGHRTYGGGYKAGTPTIGFVSCAIPTAFSAAGGEGLPLTDAELRLQVAVIADGYFGANTNWCVVRLKRPRKIAQMREVLGAAGVEYNETTPEYKGAEGFHIFRFNAPRRDKEFTEWYWGANRAQLELIAAESLLWDGSTKHGGMFRACVKRSADFIQYAFCATGRTARVTAFPREGKSTEYVVTVRNLSRLLVHNRHGGTVYPAPSTDGFKYCFMVPSTFLIFRRNGCVFASGNTGKTASVIWAADYLMKLGKVKRVLVVCPLSIMKSAWQQDLFKFAMHRSCSVAHGDAKARAKIIKAGAEFVIINFDGLQVVKDEIIAGKFDLIVADEATFLKTHTTTRWKIFNDIAKHATRLWLLTGTPAAQSPVDAFGLAKLVNPENTPRYFGSFRDQVMYKVTQFKWAPKPHAQALVHQVLQPAIRFEKKDCLDLPEVTHVERDAPLTPQQRTYYNTLSRQLRFEADNEHVSAVNAASRILKLLQISGGAVYSDTREVIEFDVSNRLRVVEEAINETENKVLVFVPFTHTIDLLKKHLDQKGISNECIDGRVSVNKRGKIVSDFQNNSDPKVLILQPQAAAHGLTLTAADTVIWYAPVTSVETYLQANARIDRPGQKNAMTVVHIQGSPVEERLYAMLRGNILNHNKIVDLYRSIVDEA